MQRICPARWSFYLGPPPAILAIFFYPLKLSSFYVFYFLIVKLVKLIEDYQIDCETGIDLNVN